MFPPREKKEPKSDKKRAAKPEDVKPVKIKVKKESNSLYSGPIVISDDSGAEDNTDDQKTQKLKKTLKSFNPEKYIDNQAPPLSILTKKRSLFHDAQQHCQYWLAEDFKEIWCVNKERLNFLDYNEENQHIFFIHKRHAPKLDNDWPEIGDQKTLTLERPWLNAQRDQDISFQIVDIHSNSISSASSRKSVIAVVKLL